MTPQQMIDIKNNDKNFVTILELNRIFLAALGQIATVGMTAEEQQDLALQALSQAEEKVKERNE